MAVEYGHDFGAACRAACMHDKGDVLTLRTPRTQLGTAVTTIIFFGVVIIAVAAAVTRSAHAALGEVEEAADRLVVNIVRR